MENILILPSSENEKNLLKALLKKMKVRFQTVDEDQYTLSDDEIADINTGLEDIENNRVVSSEDIRKMMGECLK